MSHLRPLILIGAIISLGCEQREPDPPAAPPAQTAPATMGAMPPKVEVKVQANGNLFVDGQPATLDAVDKRFVELAKAQGVVWYYREAGHAEPPPVANKVIELVVKHRLPISMSSKPDFSDIIDEKGVSHPQ